MIILKVHGYHRDIVPSLFGIRVLHAKNTGEEFPVPSTEHIPKKMRGRILILDDEVRAVDSPVVLESAGTRLSLGVGGLRIPSAAITIGRPIFLHVGLQPNAVSDISAGDMIPKAIASNNEKVSPAHPLALDL